MLLSSHFQRFCRDLHTEAIDHIVAGASPRAIQAVLRSRLLENRKLDRGNPNLAHLGSDFGRFGFDFWPAVRSHHPKNGARTTLIDDLARWRNAIAHHDFGSSAGQLRPPPPLGLSAVKRWRAACNALAIEIDAVLADQVHSLVGSRPW
jgi:hypothetical protein